MNLNHVAHAATNWTTINYWIMSVFGVLGTVYGVVMHLVHRKDVAKRKGCEAKREEETKDGDWRFIKDNQAVRDSFYEKLLAYDRNTASRMIGIEKQLDEMCRDLTEIKATTSSVKTTLDERAKGGDLLVIGGIKAELHQFFSEFKYYSSRHHTYMSVLDDKLEKIRNVDLGYCEVQLRELTNELKRIKMATTNDTTKPEHEADKTTGTKPPCASGDKGVCKKKASTNPPK